MSDKTVLKGDKAGGFLDMLVNKGKLPTVEVAVSKDTLVQLGLMIIISVTVVVLMTNIFKQIFMK